jgi:hypothetical protein
MPKKMQRLTAEFEGKLLSGGTDPQLLRTMAGETQQVRSELDVRRDVVLAQAEALYQSLILFLIGGVKIDQSILQRGNALVKELQGISRLNNSAGKPALVDTQLRSDHVSLDGKLAAILTMVQVEK